MQLLIVIVCKILWVNFTILKDGTKYYLTKMLNDIRRMEEQVVSVAV